MKRVPGSSDEQKSYQDILQEEIAEGLNQLERPASGLVLSAVSAGLDIGFGPFLMAVILTLAGGSWSEPATELLMANVYAVGFVLVILGRSELFTEHTTLAFLPVLDGQASVRQLAQLWGLVYVGNIADAVAFSAFGAFLGPGLAAVEPHVFVELARSLTHYGWVMLLSAGVLAGWLMGLLSWLVTAAQETISRVVLVWIIATTISLAHLPHSIAGSVEVLLGVFSSNAITFLDYGRFLLFSSIGNLVGGVVFVALLKYGHVVRGGDDVGESADDAEGSDEERAHPPQRTP